MGEDDLLHHIAERSRGLSALFPRVLVGPGHDCALVDAASGTGAAPTLLKTDQLVEGRHFRAIPATPIDLVARKSIARVVSDIAACGGTPIAALASATLPATFAHADALFDAMSRWARHWGCPLVGGDIASLGKSQPGPLVLCVGAIGLPHARRGMLRRDGARPGDEVYVTGALGGSFDHASGLGRHLTFEPRLQESRFLCEALGVSLHAMMDISDGLGRDAGRLARASGVRIEIDAALLPIAPELHGESPEHRWKHAMGDGEDYELLFCVTGGTRVPATCPGTGVALARVGRVLAGKGCCVRTPQGIEIDAAGMGWEHGSLDSV
jgi:thiamine-monophosphate kinase